MKKKFMLLALLVATRGECAELVLAEHGRTEYQLVLPDAAPSPSVGECLQQAARLLQTAFKANGFDVPVVAETKRDTAKPAIFLGDTAFARGQKVDVAKLTGWGYVQKIVGRDVIIVGRDQPSPSKPNQEQRQTWDRIGTAKGVVDFLRQYVGTRFLYPDLGAYEPIKSAATIDLLNSPAFEFLNTPTIAIPADLNVTKTPLIEFNTTHPARGSFYDIAHNRFPLVDTIFGGHTYERAVPREKFGESHPEYFALIGEQRTAKETGNAQYCISNPEVQELFYQDLINAIDRGFETVDLGQPDGFRACQCEKCAKLYDTGGDWGEKLWVLHRKLAERVEQARPGKRVTIMSYIQTANPPKSFKTFPPNTRVMLTGTNEEDIAPWREYGVPAGFSSYIYNWCPNLGTRYTPMRTPLYVESQVRRLTQNKFQSVYRDGAGDLFGLEGPVYYTMGRMFDDPENLQAKLLVHEFCGAAFGKAAPPMNTFYDALYHAIELYSDFLGTRSPAWVYNDIYGQRRKHLTDPFQLLGFLYTPDLLASLETQLAQAEKTADTDKVRIRLTMVRREFDYLKALAKVVHLYHAFQMQPDLASRDRLLDAIDARNELIDSFFDEKGASAKPMAGWTCLTFPPVGHDAKHLRLVYDRYQEPFAKSPVNWDTKAMRLAPPAKQSLQERGVDTPKQPATALERATTQVSLGKTLLLERNYAAARIEFTKALAMSDLSDVLKTDIQLNIGLSYYEARDYERAKPELLKVLEMPDADARPRQLDTSGRMFYVPAREAMLRLRFRNLITDDKKVLKVLFIGSSHTYRHDIPGLVTQLAASAPAGQPRIIAGDFIRMGTTIDRFWNEGDTPDTARGVIAAEPWDAVVFETFYTMKQDNLLRYGTLFADLIRSRNAKPILYESPIAQASVYPDAYRKFHEDNVAVAKGLKALVAPSVQAWMQYLGPKPTAEQFATVYDDWIHATPRGAYMTACCIYSALTGLSPVGLAHAGITDTDAKLLQQASWTAFLETNPEVKR